MERYESMGTVGEGSYGIVLKCKDNSNGSIVAIKKFLEPEYDKVVKKIASREIKILKSLRHENLINLLEVFRKNKRIYLVFEFIEQNLLEEIEKTTSGLGEAKTREIIFQVSRGVDFMHTNNVIHRDLKPENVLINNEGLVKLCDFGFARQIAQPNEVYTEYVATRWYRSPELLVGDPKYGKPVDIWSIGVLLYEVLTSKALYPGESDLDQLHLIINSLGDLPDSMKACFKSNQFFANVKIPRIKNLTPLKNKLRKYSPDLVAFIIETLTIDPHKRMSSSEVLQHKFFTNNGWNEEFLAKLNLLVKTHNSKLTRLSTTPNTNAKAAFNLPLSTNSNNLTIAHTAVSNNTANPTKNLNQLDTNKNDISVITVNTASNSRLSSSNRSNKQQAKTSNTELQQHESVTTISILPNKKDSQTDATTSKKNIFDKSIHSMINYTLANNCNNSNISNPTNFDDLFISNLVLNTSEPNLNQTNNPSQNVNNNNNNNNSINNGKMKLTFLKSNNELKPTYLNSNSLNDQNAKKKKLILESLQIIKQPVKDTNNNTSNKNSNASNNGIANFPKIERQITESPRVDIIQASNSINVSENSIFNNANNNINGINVYVKPKNPFATHSFNNKFNYSSLTNAKKNVNTIDFNLFNTSVSNESLLSDSNLSLNEFKDFKLSSNMNSNTNGFSNNHAYLTNNTTSNSNNLLSSQNNGLSGPNLKSNALLEKNSFYIFDDNFKISKKPTHLKSNLNNETSNKFSNSKPDPSKINGLDNGTSFRLPHVKSIEMYLKSNKPVIYETKKPFAMQVNNKK